MFSTLPKRNFSFSVTFILSSANAFNLSWSKIMSFGRVKSYSVEFEKIRCINLFPNKHLFLHICSTKSFENTVGKEEIARNEQFLLFPQCFLPCWRTFCHFHQIRNCHLQTLSVWKSLKFVVLERVNC